MAFALDEGAVADTEVLLNETGEIVKAEAKKASDGITSLMNTNWQGGAMTAAHNKQTVDFDETVRKLYGEITRVSEALGLSRVGAVESDQSSEQSISSIDPGAFGRLSV